MIDEAKLHKALICMGSRPLHKKYRSKWSDECPTRGYCVIVSLLILHYCTPKGSKLFYVKLNNGETHYYVKTPDGERIDYTKNQYDHTICYDGERASPLKFKSIMPKVQKLATLLGLELKTK